MATASAATLSMEPDGVIPMKVSRRGYRTAHPSGQVHARQVQSAASPNSLLREIRSWKLTYNYRTDAQRTTLRAVWIDSRAGAARVDWTPPDEGSAIQVRIMGETYRETYDGSLYSINFNIEEVL